MTITIVNPFKSETTKAFDKGKIGRDVHPGECFPSADVNLCSGNKFFKFGTITTVVDDNLSKPKSLECVAVQSSSCFNVCVDTHVETRGIILSKVKSAKDNITKLFKPTGHVSGAVPSIDSFAIPNVEHITMNDHLSSLTPPFIVQHAEPKAHGITVYESTPPRDAGLEIIASPIAYGENVVDLHIEDLASTFCSVVDASPPSPNAQLFTTPVSQLDRFPSAFFLGGLHTIEEEDRNTGVVVGVMSTGQKELTTSCSYISLSNSDSEVTVYLSSDILSDHSTPYGVGLIGSGTNTSPVDTSFATSVDAEDSHQLSAGALRGLRRVPNYEDLRNSHIANRGSSHSDMSCGSSECDFSYGAASGINAMPLRRSTKYNNLRKSFLSFEPKICTPSTRRMNKYKKLRTWLKTRWHESSRNMQKPSASRAPSEPQKVTSVSRSRRFLQNIFHPLHRVQAHGFKPSPPFPSPPPSPPVWSCAKITRSSSETKKRRKMTKQSMRKLKARLDSMDIDPWY